MSDPQNQEIIADRAERDHHNSPVRIWATVNGASTRLPDGARQLIGGWSEDSSRPRSTEYIRADVVASLTAERDRLREALARLVYEATHLSPMQDDGSHVCAISSVALKNARAALSGTAPETGRVSDWQPIETAPRDGREILLNGLLVPPCVDAGERSTVIGYWTDHNSGGWVWHGAVATRFEWWMPLPAQPRASLNGGSDE